jgi:hypothetical protein
MRFVLSYAACAVPVSLSGNITEHCTHKCKLFNFLSFEHKSTFQCFLQIKTLP